MTVFEQPHKSREGLLCYFIPRNDKYIRTDCFVISFLAMTITRIKQSLRAPIF